MPKIAIVGAFSGRSIGDEAILESTCLHLQSAFPDDLQIVVPTKYARYIGTHFPVQAIQSRLGTLTPRAIRAVLSCDAVLFTQQNFFHRKLLQPWYNQMPAYSVIVTLAPRLGVKAITYNSGVGPLSTYASRVLARYIMRKCEWATFRDSDSMKLAQQIGVNNVDMSLTADPVLSLPACTEERALEIISDTGLDPLRPCIAWNVTSDIGPKAAVDVSLSPHQVRSLMASSIVEIVSALDCQVLLAPSSFDDLAFSLEVAQECDRAGVAHLPWKIMPREYIGVVRRCELMVGMRLHAIIMAAAAHTVPVAIPYHPKVESFLDFVNLPDAVISLKELSPEKLREKVNMVWSQRCRLGETLAYRAKELGRRAESSVFKLRESLMEGK